MSTNSSQDDTFEPVYDAVLDTLTDAQFTEFLDSGKLPSGIEINSSSSEADSGASDNTSPDEANKNSEEEEPDTEQDSTSNEEDTSEQTNEEESEQLDKESDDVFKQLFSKPIKANGSEFVLENFDEALSLIQKGAGYEAKMKKLKPAQKIMKTFEQNKISEADISFFIDLHKGDKTAIKELLKKHNLDTLQIDEVEQKYEHSSKNVMSDDALKLSMNAEAIAESPYSSRIDDIVFNVWDEQSKNLIASRPETLMELLEEFKLGRFDIIQSIVARENALGINKVPDIIRYGELAKMYQDGQLKLNTPKAEQTKVEKKKSARPTAKVAETKKVEKKSPSDYSIKELDKMSDEEYLKLFG